MRPGLTGRFEPMSWRDAAFVYDETANRPETVIACYAFPASPDMPSVASEAAFREWVRARLGAADFFTHRVRRLPLDLAHPVWVPAPDLDPAAHVRFHPDVGDTLRESLTAIAATPVDLARPPWELHALTGAHGIPGLDEAVVVVLKVHHCAADGVEARRVEAELFAPTPPPPPRLPPDTARPALTAETTTRAALGAPLALARFVRRVRATADDAREAARRRASGELTVPARDRPRTRFNSPSSGRLVFGITRLRLEDVRAARVSAEGATVNDVLLTITGGALVRLLADLDDSPSDSLAALVPISLRLPDSSSGRPRDVGTDTSGTRLVLGTVRLHTDLTEPVARLAAVSRSSAAEKARWLDPASVRAGTRQEVAPAWLLSLRAASHRSARRRHPDRPVLSNTMISNVPPPAGRPALDGVPLDLAFGILPIIDGDRLRHVFTTCGDHIALSVSADPELLTPLDGYLRLIAEELAILVTAANRED